MEGKKKGTGGFNGQKKFVKNSACKKSGRDLEMAFRNKALIESLHETIF